MIDLLLLGGMALMALSLVLAVVSLARTEPPRAAAAAFVFGVAAMLLAAWLDPEPFRIQQIGEAWSRLVSGQAIR